MAEAGSRGCEIRFYLDSIAEAGNGLIKPLQFGLILSIRHRRLFLPAAGLLAARAELPFGRVPSHLTGARDDAPTGWPVDIDGTPRPQGAGIDRSAHEARGMKASRG